MPSTTQKQARFMSAVAHGWKPTRKGVKAPPLKVAREFNKADTGSKMLRKGMKQRRKKKYQGGGLAMATKMAGMPPNRMGMMKPTMPTRVPPGMMGRIPPGKRIPGQPMQVPPRGMPDLRSRMMGQTGALRQALSGTRGGPGKPLPARGMVGRSVPPRLGLGRFRGAGGNLGPARRAQLGPGTQGAFRGIGRPPAPASALLRTAGDRSGLAGMQLNRLMSGLQSARRPFAKGGSVKRAIAALKKARDALHDSDPNFDDIADYLKQNVPEARGLASRIKKTANKKPKTNDPDEFRQDWLDINKEFKEIQKKLGSE